MTRARILGGTLATVVAVAAPMGAYYEGVFPVGYLDPVRIPTDCIGETDGARVGVQRFTVEQCISRYDERLRRNWESLSRCVHRDVTVPQAAALVSFSDNVGVPRTCSSTMVRQLNAGASPAEWCAQISRWNQATVLGVLVELPGLTKRRASERAMCNGDVNAWKVKR